MQASQSVRGWIEDLPKRGRITFGMEDAMRQFSHMPKETVRSSIYRLISKERVRSVWRDFYVIVPDEYALRGFVPPIEYMDNLMRHIGHKYYVGLLSAAALYGSSHQQPQSLTVVVDSNDIRSKDAPDVGFRFVAKTPIHESFLESKNASYGEVKISDPVMTALDLILYENRIGGLERAATVIEGLVDEFDIAGSDPAMWATFPIPVIQRFGYIVDSILGNTELADIVYQKTRDMKIAFRKTFLDLGTESRGNEGYSFDPRWKVIVNTDLEVD